MLLRLPSPPITSFLSTSTPNRSRFSSSPSSPLPLRLRHSLFRCAAKNDVVLDVDAFTAKSGYLFELSAAEAESLVDYDISKIGAIYRRKPLILFRRLFQIAVTFGRWFALRYVDNLMDRSDQMFEVALQF